MNKPLDFNRDVVFADECFPCDYCGEPICPVCEEHYAECPCPGPFSEPEEDECETMTLHTRRC